MGGTEEGILLGYRVKVPSVMLPCQDRIIRLLMFLCLDSLLNRGIALQSLFFFTCFGGARSVCFRYKVDLKKGVS